jgi:hypothetical protein
VLEAILQMRFWPQDTGGTPFRQFFKDRLGRSPSFGQRIALLKSGSCFVQIGDENSHLVKSLLDEAFTAEPSVSHISSQETGA